MNFVPVAIVIAAISGINTSQPTSYKTAFLRAQQDDRPLLVLVSAKWCPPCQMMKRSTIPQLIEANKFQGFHFATVDLDDNPVDARNLIGTRGVPQLVLYERQNGQWKSRFLSGFHDVASVETFIGSTSELRTAQIPSLAADK